MLKRIFLFILTNLAVVFLINIILIIVSSVFNINVTAYGGSYTSIFIFALIVGFSGAFISLMISKWTAKRAYKIDIITQNDFSRISSKEKLVYDTVLDIANSHGIKTPEVGIYQSRDPNAFATGPTKNKSLVAVSSGLLDNMNEDQIQGVVAHEMAHVLNGDMVTMTLLQGVMNTFVIFLSRIIANIVDSYFSSDENSGPSFIYYGVSLVLDLVFGLLAGMIVNAFSRMREFKADEGSARYVGKEKMISALKALQSEQAKLHESNPKLATAMISSPKSRGISALFMSHPPLEKRIENIENFSV